MPLVGRTSLPSLVHEILAVRPEWGVSGNFVPGGIPLFFAPPVHRKETMEDARAKLKAKLREKRLERTGGVSGDRLNQVAKAESKVQELCGDNAELLQMAHSMIHGKGMPRMPEKNSQDWEEEEEAPPPG